MIADAPGRRCDIVMKGGVTSGIVYPPAVLELARAFRFVNIGGTSAGAIAASLTAAAEYRRINGGGLAGFERLARIPEELAEDGALVKLFAPNEPTQLVFNELLSWLGAGNVAKIIGRFATLPFRSSKSGVALAIVGAGISAASVEIATGGSNAVYGAIATIAIAIVIGGAISMYRTIAHAIAAIVANGFGLATGIDENDPDDATYLGVWLGNMLDEIAGLAPGDHLTFGHLWYGRPPVENDPKTVPSDPDPDPLINLEMVSTCISHARPYTFPTGQNVFCYRPEILKKYLHADIVQMMERHARPPGSTKSLTPEQMLPYVRMPVDRDLPVALAVRMSLAFPLLLSAVELGASAYDRTPEDAREKNTETYPEPCWFADGGLTSNFPVHLFDGPLPRWPTFAINLGTFAPDESDYFSDESRNVTMAMDNKSDIAEHWSRFGTLPSYLGAMFNAIKDWNDSVQMTMPGFRDRIVTVKLRASEGGLNLNMGPEQIAPLVARGRAAGQMLVRRFAVPSVGAATSAMDWENHRIVRYRVAMSAGQRFLGTFARGYGGAQPGDASYDDLLKAYETTGFPAYPLNDATTRTRARGITLAAATLWSWLGGTGANFNDKRAPHPAPDLVKRARF